jgi:hypothetical protein
MGFDTRESNIWESDKRKLGLTGTTFWRFSLEQRLNVGYQYLMFILLNLGYGLISPVCF